MISIATTIIIITSIIIIVIIIMVITIITIMIITISIGIIIVYWYLVRDGRMGWWLMVSTGHSPIPC
jgi:hypothetical protein